MAFFKRELSPFFKRELSPVERFERALKSKQVERGKLAARAGAAEALLTDKRAAAERLAVAGAATSRLAQAEATLREVEERAKTLRAELAELDEQIVAAERALIEATAQRDRQLAADQIEALAVAIEQAVPQFGAGASALVGAVSNGVASVAEATRFAGNVEAMRREVLSAADLICWELRALAVRTRAGNANRALAAPDEDHRAPSPEIERQMIYTLNPLLWREGSEVRKAGAFTVVALPTALLPTALRHQHVDYLNARRVQTLMHVHGSEAQGEAPDDAQLVDLDALAADDQEGARASVA
ncbi:hypothetical protein [Bradyrhizobium sp. NP1]|uniref:hypothetical protein n=1 Tax=Bradyrhizobium sp. NP1 TaxID=3049772 RepID=UPI0025A6261D|nr:hypothetical protein [Bradyrhizobium sp. NP1]WJR75224.1 hypothetical protein QOU61_20660 [Bradyrhizobium sp. NP1]